MSPARALLAARLQLLWNLAHRSKGPLATPAAVLLVALAACLLIPPFLLFFSFGEVLGQDMPADGSPAIFWLTGLQLLILFGLGAAAGLRHHAGFDQQLLKQFPLKPGQILLAELPFNVLDTIPLIGFAFQAGLGAGLLRAQPGAWPHVVPAVLGGMAGILLVQQAVGAARRLVSRSRALALAAAAALVLGVILLVLVSRRPIDEALAVLVTWLPPTASFSAVRAATRGETGLAWTLQGLGLAFTAGLVALSVRLQLAELRQDPPLRTEGSGAARPWTFQAPWQGLARLFVEQVLGSRHGKLLLLLPLFCTGMFVLVADILRRSGAPADSTSFQATLHQIFERAQALPLYALVPPATVLLVGRDFWLNQFAWSGGGVKAIFLAPVRTADLLRGTLAGLLLLQLPQGLLACAPLARLRGPLPFELLNGLTAALLTATVLAAFGHVVSARHPRALVGREERAEGLPPLPALVSGLAVVALAALVVAGASLAGSVGPWAPAAIFGTLWGLSLLAYRAALPRLSREVDDERETMSETLG